MKLTKIVVELAHLSHRLVCTVLDINQVMLYMPTMFPLSANVIMGIENTYNAVIAFAPDSE